MVTNLTDQEIKERMNIRIQDFDSQRKTNLDHIVVIKKAIKIRSLECQCQTRLKGNIKHFQIVNAAIELEINLLRNYLQCLEQEKSVSNKIEEKKRIQSNKRLVEGGNTRIMLKKQEQQTILRKLREKEKELEEKELGCKCNADYLKQLILLENENAIIDVEIELLTKYYQDENLLLKYLAGTTLD